MDVQKWLTWAVLMLLIGLVYSLLSGVGYLSLLQQWWFAALVSAAIINWTPDFTIEFESQLSDWVAWTLILGVLYAFCGWGMYGEALTLFTMWHWGVALVSAVVMYFIAPWGKQFLPA